MSARQAIKYSTTDFVVYFASMAYFCNATLYIYFTLQMQNHNARMHIFSLGRSPANKQTNENDL